MEFSSKDPFPEPCSKNTPKFILILGKNKTHKVFLNYGKYTYTNTYIAIFAPFAYLVPKEAEECDKSPGQGFKVVLSHLMRALVFKRGYPTAALLLRQIPDSQICHYSVEDEDVPVLLLLSLTS